MKALHFFKILICLLIFGFLAEDTYGQSFVTGKTLISGIIEGNHTWTIAESPFVIDENISIRPDARLKIEEGVIVGFWPGKKIIVDGTLIIEGTAENPVTFTSAKYLFATELLPWGGIEISGNYAEVDIKFLDGQFAETLFHINTPSANPIEISHSFLRDNQTAIELSRLSNGIHLHHNYISDNGSGIIFKTPIPAKRIIYNQIRNNSVFNVINLSGKPIDLRNNCWKKEDLVDVDPSKNDHSHEVIGDEIVKKPASNYCQPIPDLMRRSGGDITVVIDDDLRTSKSEPFATIKFKVFPNPAREEIKLEYESLILDKLMIINTLGQVVGVFEQIPPNRFTIPISHLASGIYYLQLDTNKGIFQQRVVVIENW